MSILEIARGCQHLEAVEWRAGHRPVIPQHLAQTVSGRLELWNTPSQYRTARDSRRRLSERAGLHILPKRRDAPVFHTDVNSNHGSANRRTSTDGGVGRRKAVCQRHIRGEGEDAVGVEFHKIGIRAHRLAFHGRTLHK